MSTYPDGPTVCHDVRDTPGRSAPAEQVEATLSVQPFTPGAGAAAALEAEKASRAEYGKYRALVPIDVDGARAYNPGHPVPIQAVEGGVRMVAELEYDPTLGQHLPVYKGAQQVLRAESFAPVVDRAAVYEVGKAGEDPNMAPEPVTLTRPPDNAKLETWQAFAVQEGMTPDEALAITDKAEFASRYPKAV